MIGTTAEDTSLLLEDLLLWGKTQSGAMQLRFEKFNLEPVIDETIESFYPLLIHKQITIQKDNFPNNIEVLADRSSLKVILRNLLSNAIKFSFKSSEILIKCSIQANNVVIGVQDKGTGMSAEKIKKLVKNEILTSNKGTQGEKGSGLGLSLSKELAEQNKGQLWVESQLKKGTTVYFSLSLA